MAMSLWSHFLGPPCTIIRISATTVSNISLQLQHDALVSEKGYVVSRQDTNRNNTKCMLSVRCHYNRTPVTPCSTEHFLKCLLTALLRLYSRSHKKQENRLYSECTGWCCLNSSAIQKRFGHSLQTYGFTASCRWTCIFRSCLWLNFIWQMSHVNQVPSLCDFSRCRWSWKGLLKQSEQCCVHDVYVSARCWSHWNSCHTVNTCTVSLPCGLSCVCLEFQTH